MGTLVLYPSPGIGHLISMVELGNLLLTQSKTLSSIIILIPSSPLPMNTAIPSYISAVSSSFPSITFQFLPPISIHADLKYYPDVESIIFEALQNNNPNVHNALKFLSSSSNVCAFIFDFFCYPALEVSRSMNILSYFFFSSSACGLSLALNLPVFDKIANDSYRNLNVSFDIPGLFSVPASHMLEPMLDRGVSYYEFVKMGETLVKADGIIVNTFEELEARAVQGLKQGTCLPNTHVPPVYCIGPLISNSAEKGDQRHECLNWLDTQPSRSVVYLGFGSLGVFSKEQTREIALGLERSNVRFLWVVRAPHNEDKSKMFEPPREPELGSLLPEGFIERTTERGLVVKSWVPQIAVLEHESVGGFVTHCGWNSVLEAVRAGVTMVAWPLYAEQRFNKIVLTEEIRVALPMDESEERFVSSDELERRLKQLMCSEEGELVRRRVLELKDKAKVTLSQEGSAKLALSKLVESWQP